MLFKEILGQQEVKKGLAELVQHNRLSHALLFLGKEGSGALPLALAFAQYLTCETVNGKRQWAVDNKQLTIGNGQEVVDNKQLTIGNGQEAMGNERLINDSCGVCASCSKAEKLVHPDIHYSYP